MKIIRVWTLLSLPALLMEPRSPDKMQFWKEVSQRRLSHGCSSVIGVCCGSGATNLNACFKCDLCLGYRWNYPGWNCGSGSNGPGCKTSPSFNCAMTALSGSYTFQSDANQGVKPLIKWNQAFQTNQDGNCYGVSQCWLTYQSGTDHSSCITQPSLGEFQIDTVQTCPRGVGYYSMSCKSAASPVTVYTTSNTFLKVEMPCPRILTASSTTFPLNMNYAHSGTQTTQAINQMTKSATSVTSCDLSYDCSLIGFPSNPATISYITTSTLDSTLTVNLNVGPPSKTTPYTYNLQQQCTSIVDTTITLTRSFTINIVCSPLTFSPTDIGYTISPTASKITSYTFTQTTLSDSSRTFNFDTWTTNCPCFDTAVTYRIVTVTKTSATSILTHSANTASTTVTAALTANNTETFYIEILTNPSAASTYRWPAITDSPSVITVVTNTLNCDSTIQSSSETYPVTVKWLDPGAGLNFKFYFEPFKEILYNYGVGCDEHKLVCVIKNLVPATVPSSTYYYYQGNLPDYQESQIIVRSDIPNTTFVNPVVYDYVEYCSTYQQTLAPATSSRSIKISVVCDTSIYSSAQIDYYMLPAGSGTQQSSYTFQQVNYYQTSATFDITAWSLWMTQCFSGTDIKYNIISASTTPCVASILTHTNPDANLTVTVDISKNCTEQFYIEVITNPAAATTFRYPTAPTTLSVQSITLNCDSAIQSNSSETQSIVLGWDLNNSTSVKYRFIQETKPYNPEPVKNCPYGMTCIVKDASSNIVVSSTYYSFAGNSPYKAESQILVRVDIPQAQFLSPQVYDYTQTCTAPLYSVSASTFTRNIKVTVQCDTTLYSNAMIGFKQKTPGTQSDTITITQTTYPTMSQTFNIQEWEFDLYNCFTGAQYNIKPSGLCASFPVASSILTHSDATSSPTVTVNMESNCTEKFYIEVLTVPSTSPSALNPTPYRYPAAAAAVPLISVTTIMLNCSSQIVVNSLETFPKTLGWNPIDSVPNKFYPMTESLLWQDSTKGCPFPKMVCRVKTNAIPSVVVASTTLYSYQSYSPANKESEIQVRVDYPNATFVNPLVLDYIQECEAPLDPNHPRNDVPTRWKETTFPKWTTSIKITIQCDYTLYSNALIGYQAIDVNYYDLGWVIGDVIQKNQENITFTNFRVFLTNCFEEYVTNYSLKSETPSPSDLFYKGNRTVQVALNSNVTAKFKLNMIATRLDGLPFTQNNIYQNASGDVWFSVNRLVYNITPVDMNYSLVQYHPNETLNITFDEIKKLFGYNWTNEAVDSIDKFLLFDEYDNSWSHWDVINYNQFLGNITIMRNNSYSETSLKLQIRLTTKSGFTWSTNLFMRFCGSEKPLKIDAEINRIEQTLFINVTKYDWQALDVSFANVFMTDTPWCPNLKFNISKSETEDIPITWVKINEQLTTFWVQRTDFYNDQNIRHLDNKTFFIKAWAGRGVHEKSIAFNVTVIKWAPELARLTNTKPYFAQIINSISLQMVKYPDGGIDFESGFYTNLGSSKKNAILFDDDGIFEYKSLSLNDNEQKVSEVSIILTPNQQPEPWLQVFSLLQGTGTQQTKYFKIKIIKNLILKKETGLVYKVQLDDGNGEMFWQFYTFTVKVDFRQLYSNTRIDPKFQLAFLGVIYEEFCDNPDGPPPKLKFDLIQKTGRVRAYFDQKMYFPQMIYQDFYNQVFNLTVHWEVDPENTLWQGNFTNVSLISNNLQQIKQENLGNLPNSTGRRQLLESRYPESSDFTFEAQITSHESKEIYIDLYFEFPDKISKSLHYDFLQIHVINPIVFRSSETNKYLEEPKDYIIPLPPIIDKKVMSVINGITDSVTDVFAFLGASSIIISLVLGGSLQYMWTMIRTLQMIVCTSLVQVPSTPAHMFNFEIGLIEVSQTEFLDGESVIDQIFEFPDTGSLNPNFEYFKMEQKNFLSNSGSFFPYVILIILYHFGLHILQLLARLLPHYYWMRLIGIHTYAQNRLESTYVGLKKLVIENWFSMFLAALLHFHSFGVDKSKNDKFENKWYNFSEAFQNVFTFCFVCMQLNIFYESYKIKDINFRHKANRKDPLKYIYVQESKISTVQRKKYFFYFILRRFIIAGTLIYMEPFPLFEMNTLLILSLFNAIYLFDCDPQKELNTVEKYNEITVYFCALIINQILNVDIPVELNYQLGWGWISIVCLNILFNFYLMIRIIVIETRNNFRESLMWRNQKNYYLQRIKNKTVISQNPELVSIYLRELKEREAIVFVKDWYKHRKWLILCKIDLSKFEEEKKYQDLIKQHGLVEKALIQRLNKAVNHLVSKHVFETMEEQKIKMNIQNSNNVDYYQQQMFDDVTKSPNVGFVDYKTKNLRHFRVNNHIDAERIVKKSKPLQLLAIRENSREQYDFVDKIDYYRENKNLIHKNLMLRGIEHSTTLGVDFYQDKHRLQQVEDYFEKVADKKQKEVLGNIIKTEKMFQLQLENNPQFASAQKKFELYAFDLSFLLERNHKEYAVELKQDLEKSNKPVMEMYQLSNGLMTFTHGGANNYMDTVLQCLFRLDPLAKYLLLKEYKIPKVKKGSQLFSKELRSLFQKVNYDQVRVLKKLHHVPIGSLQNYDRFLRVITQDKMTDDASIFIKFVIQMLKEEVKFNEKAAPIHDAQKYFTQLFNFKISNAIVCRASHVLEHVDTPSYYVQLPVLSSVQKSIAKLFDPGRVWKTCQKCKSKEVQEVVYFIDQSEILVLNFSVITPLKSILKFDDSTIPEFFDACDFQEQYFFKQPITSQYKLHAVIHLEGTHMDQSQYFAIVRRKLAESSDEAWYKIRGTIAEIISQEEVIHNLNPQVLVYEKISTKTLIDK